MSDNFEFLGKIGQGAFATVYKVKRHQDSNIYAFKKMKTMKMTDRQLSNTLNEIRILASLNNPYIIGYKEAFYDSSLKSFCLVTQFAQGGDLSFRINQIRKSNSNFSENYIWKVALQLLHGIKSLHSLKVFHRDIKPANILLTKNDECAKLADMNVSVISKTGIASTQTGTPYYASPQVWMEKPYNGKSDIWSFGCVLYELASLKTPFTAADLPGLRRRIIQSPIEAIPSKYSKQLQVFINILLQKDQRVRPTVLQILNLPIIKQKMKLFPNQKFNESYLPSIQKSCNMIGTIRVDNGNLRSLQNRLPKCNYQNGKENQKGSENRIQKNLSCVAKISQKQSPKQKLPQIRRPDSSSKVEDKVVMKRELLKILR